MTRHSEGHDRSKALEQLNAYVLVAFHLVLSLMALMLGYLGMIMWPDVAGVSPLLEITLLGLGVLTTHYFSFIASRDIIRAIRADSAMPKLNLMPFLCGVFTIVVATYMLGGR